MHKHDYGRNVIPAITGATISFLLLLTSNTLTALIIYFLCFATLSTLSYSMIKRYTFTDDELKRYKARERESKEYFDFVRDNAKKKRREL